jgi:hypothetical protein
VITYLSIEELAHRRGIAPGTARGYLVTCLKRDEWHLLPKPDSVTGATGPRPRYGWLPETADSWQRIGQGTRTDLPRAGTPQR